MERPKFEKKHIKKLCLNEVFLTFAKRDKYTIWETEAHSLNML